MMEERQRTLSEKHMERLKRKNLNVELAESFNKMDKFRKLEKSFGKVNLNLINKILDYLPK